MIVPLITLRSWEIPVHICSVLHIVQREMFAGANFHRVTRGASSRNVRVFNFFTCLTWDHTQIFVEPRPTPPGTSSPRCAPYSISDHLQTPSKNDAVQQ